MRRQHSCAQDGSKWSVASLCFSKERLERVPSSPAWRTWLTNSAQVDELDRKFVLSRLDTHAPPVGLGLSTLGPTADVAEEPFARPDDSLILLDSANLASEEVHEAESTPLLTGRVSTTEP
ncbi:hypothetical protein ACE6H2_027726 [Prunus campanulata]